MIITQHYKKTLFILLLGFHLALLFIVLNKFDRTCIFVSFAVFHQIPRHRHHDRHHHHHRTKHPSPTLFQWWSTRSSSYDPQWARKAKKKTYHSLLLQPLLLLVLIVATASPVSLLERKYGRLSLWRLGPSERACVNQWK